MTDRPHRAFFLLVFSLEAAGVLAACGSGDDEGEAGAGFGQCVTSDQGFSSCDAYCASLSRACVLCDCPDDHRDDYLCSGERSERQYSAIGWKSNVACEGQIITAFTGCTQSVFQDPSGALVAMSVKCCCE